MHCGFNPRTRESATDIFRGTGDGTKVSIHALVRVRRYSMTDELLINSFNPRTRESATMDLAAAVDGGNVSIHALVRVRQTIERNKTMSNQFQSTHS